MRQRRCRRTGAVALADGSVVAWGWNALGQLGDGTTRDRWQFAPAAVPPAIAVADGPLHTLAA